MVSEHPVFNFPPNEDQKIWRYMDFTKFIDLLITKSLYFCRVDLFDDIFEGSVTRITAKKRDGLSPVRDKKGEIISDFWKNISIQSRKQNAINCWHMNNQESAAMWKLYLNSNEGIAVQSTFKKLKDCLNESDLSIHLGTIKYVDYDHVDIGWGNGFIPFVHKRKSFEHENELRALIWEIEKENKDKVNLSEGGVSVQIDVLKLIENVYVSPASPKWFLALV